jgi:hypothetical protein
MPLAFHHRLRRSLAKLGTASVTPKPPELSEDCIAAVDALVVERLSYKSPETNS